jgi:CheY-like chemotaxis protein
MHGGFLSAVSAGPGQGSTFSFFLPHAGIMGHGEAAGSAPAPVVMVVDDNRDAANSLAEILRLMDYQVKVAYDGPSALELVREAMPRLIVLDIGMPDMNGYEVLTALRALPGGDGVTAAALTGFGTDEDKGRALAAGFDVHLTKPLDFAALQDFLQSADMPV